MFGRIILSIVSFLFFPLGWILGAWYFFKKQDKTWGAIFIGLGLLAFIVIIITSATGTNDSGTTHRSNNAQKSAPPPTTAPVPTSVSLREILDLRDANEVAADSKYIGMYMSMEGVLNEIHEKDIYIIPIGSDEFQMAGAECKFDETQLPDLVELRKGQTVTLVGTIKDINDFMFNKIEVKPCQFR